MIVSVGFTAPIADPLANNPPQRHRPNAPASPSCSAATLCGHLMTHNPFMPKKRPAGFSFKLIGVQAQGRSTILRVNYRNTDDIQRFAYEFAKEIMTPTAADDDRGTVAQTGDGRAAGSRPTVERLSTLQAEAADLRASLGRVIPGDCLERNGDSIQRSIRRRRTNQSADQPRYPFQVAEGPRFEAL